MANIVIKTRNAISDIKSSVRVLCLNCEVVFKYTFTMNKYLIVLMAICLVSVHAFVKRDTAAPAQTPNYLEDLQNQLQTLGKTINEKVKEAFNPEDLKKSIDQLAATANKLLTPAKEQKA